jgi:hypothetical protein
MGGVQLGPLDTSATKWPIVPAPGDYDDGEIGGMKIIVIVIVILYLSVTTKCVWLAVGQQWTSVFAQCCENVCLASHWLAMDFRSGATILVFRRHVTI